MPLLVLPLGTSLLILFISLKKQSRYSIQVVFVILWSFSIGLTSEILWRWVEYPWQRLNENQVSKADAIVVLSGGSLQKVSGDTNFFEWNDPDRFFAGIKLFQAGKAPKLLFTGGANPFNSDMPPEGNIYIKKAIDLGIPKKALSTTGRVFNTAEESKRIRKLFKKENSSPKILLVTSAYHMKRAKRQFERAGFLVEPYPVDFKSGNYSKSLNWKNPLEWVPNARNLDRSSIALREILGRIVYRSW